jgi:CHAT domain-containing protein
LRALVVADTKSAQPALALPGAAAEGRAVADEIRGSGIGEVRLLLGPAATHDALATAFDEFAPDVFHFAGHAWFDEHEAYLELADRHLTASMMRPWLTRHPPAFMFLNSHYTAFIPAGVEGHGGAHAEAISAGLRGRPGFADLAMRSGVGAFLGTYSGAIDDNGARDFALAIFRALLQGETAAGALQSARRLAHEQGSATALLYCLYGEGALRLVDAGEGG